MAQSKPDQQFPGTITTTGPVAKFVTLWNDFRMRRAGWFAQVGSLEPIYFLPEKAIARLVLTTPTSRAIIDTTSAEAERELLAICQRANSVGFWQNKEVLYPHLSPRPSRVDLKALLRLFPESDRQAGLALADMSDDMTPRVTGYVGWLRTELTFLQEVRGLAQRWQQLPSKERPSFPLGRPMPWPQKPQGAVLATQGTIRFAQDLAAFLDRWSLMHLATWDLPNPQGPLLPNPLPEGSPALPGHGVHTVVPVHYPVLGLDDLPREIGRQQKQLAREAGLDPSVAGLPHFAVYAQILNVIHLEQIIVQRYGQGTRPKAFMTRMEEAIADVLDCGLANVKKLRKGISACLRGRRHEVPWLRPRAR